MKRYIIAGVLAIGLFFGSSVAFTESYFHPYPYIDTNLSEGFSWDKYESINKGMTRENVMHILGGPISTFSNEDWPAECWQYSDDGGKYAFWDFAWFSVDVCFDASGKVTSKNQTIHYD